MADDSDRGQRGEIMRQAAVFASGVLGMRADPRLRSIVERAAALLRTPIAAISIVDRDRQWFPAIVGIEAEETAREVSFCAHAIRIPDETMIVPDTRDDERFAANPLVTGDPHIRFYAGVPLVAAGGQPLGALCAIDREARPRLTEEEEAGLRALAREAVIEIERVENLRRVGTDAIEFVLSQIRAAAKQEDEALLLSLDRILQDMEARIASSFDPAQR